MSDDGQCPNCGQDYVDTAYHMFCDGWLRTDKCYEAEIERLKGIVDQMPKAADIKQLCVEARHALNASHHSETWARSTWRQQLTDAIKRVEREKH